MFHKIPEIIRVSKNKMRVEAIRYLRKARFCVMLKSQTERLLTLHFFLLVACRELTDRWVITTKMAMESVTVRDGQCLTMTANRFTSLFRHLFQSSWRIIALGEIKSPTR